MSLSQHINQRIPESHSESRSINKSVEISPVLIAIESFEELQLLNLQAIINKIAMQIQKGFNAIENGEPTPPLALLRVYAQYLNLYMKLKDKCKKSGAIKPETPKDEDKVSVKSSAKPAAAQVTEHRQPSGQPLSVSSETPDQAKTVTEPVKANPVINRLPHDAITNTQLKKALNGT